MLHLLQRINLLQLAGIQQVRIFERRLQIGKRNFPCDRRHNIQQVPSPSPPVSDEPIPISTRIPVGCSHRCLPN